MITIDSVTSTNAVKSTTVSARGHADLPNSGREEGGTP